MSWGVALVWLSPPPPPPPPPLARMHNVSAHSH